MCPCARSEFRRCRLRGQWFDRKTPIPAERAYHSPYPDIATALITRASDGASAVEWETETVPADWGRRPATFVWLAGLATGKGGHLFELFVDGEKAFDLRTSADSSRREWRETGAGGIVLSFKTVMVDQFDELFGFMWLDVPAARLRPGRPLRIKIAGEKAGSNDWVMTFCDDLRREVWARSEQALVRGEGGQVFQIVRVEMSHLGPPAKAVVSCGEAAKASLDLKLGYNALELPNGAGKSTLLLQMNGYILPSSGLINIGDLEMTKKTRQDIRKKVGVVFQNPDDQLFMPTVYEDVAFGPLNLGMSNERAADRVNSALLTIGCLDLAAKPPPSSFCRPEKGGRNCDCIGHGARYSGHG